MRKNKKSLVGLGEVIAHKAQTMTMATRAVVVEVSRGGTSVVAIEEDLVRAKAPLVVMILVGTEAVAEEVEVAVVEEAIIGDRERKLTTA